MKLFGNKRNAAHHRRKPRRVLKVLTVLLFCCLILTGAVYAFLNLYATPPDTSGGTYNPPAPTPNPDTEPIDEPDEPDEQDPLDSTRTTGIYTVLVVGQDEVGTNTDTMMLASFDSINKTIDVVSIPRDTLVDIPYSVKKINSVMAQLGIDGLMEVVADLTGFEPDNYVVVDLEGFQALVDTLGGVWFDVPRYMEYEDPAQDLSIYVHAGYQLLDGATAVQVVRWRQDNHGGGYTDADIGRISTQQGFLKAVASQLIQFDNVTKITEFVEIFNTYVETDMDLSTMVWYGTQMLGMDMDNINFHTVPGNYDIYILGGSYVTVYVDEWLELINRVLNPFPDQVTLEHINIYTDDEMGILTQYGQGRHLYIRNRPAVS